MDYTGTDNQKQGNKTPHTLVHPKHKREKEKKTFLANNLHMVWYAFYHLQPGNEMDPILTTPEPHEAYWSSH